MIYNDFKKLSKYKWCACDTETYTLIDGVRVTTQQLEQLANVHNTAWFREHASIDTYAWQISCGRENCICNNFIEWLDTMALHGIACAWFYNAKFDFSQIDYQILSSEDFAPYSSDLKGQGVDMYESLHNPYGARYMYTIWHYYENKEHKKVCHKIKIYDLCNIFVGGLAKLLKDFDIEDEDGNKLRKLEMDYQDNKDANGNYTKEAIDYMIVDVKGLHYLIKKCDAYIKERYNMKLTPKPDFMTAGGFAKKLLLETLYKTGDYKENLQAFQKDYRMWLDLDRYFREGGLYQGGKCIVNPVYQNKLVANNFVRLDYNSHYPARMREGVAFKGKLYKMSYEEYKRTCNDNEFIYILHLKSFRGFLKPKMVAVWYDFLLKKYTASPYCEDANGLLIFKFEFEEYLHYYDMDYEIDFVIAYKRQYDAGYIEFVDDVYKDKTEGKKTYNVCQEKFSKLGLNSAYGKFAQNPYQAETHREINEETGAVHLVIDSIKADEDALMSVVQGAYITARGRAVICKDIRTKCKHSPIEDFYYCDTDSIHGDYVADTDAYNIGALKLEASCHYGLFLAPKTYFEIDNDNIIEVHTKGVPTKVIYNAMIEAGAIDKDKKVLSIDKVCDIFKAGNKFQCLSAMNLKGGKGLIPLYKELCRLENARSDTMSNMAGEQIMFESELNINDVEKLEKEGITNNV